MFGNAMRVAAKPVMHVARAKNALQHILRIRSRMKVTCLYKIQSMRYKKAGVLSQMGAMRIGGTNYE